MKKFIKLLREKNRHGLIIYGISNRLSKMGLEIRPYYWEKEYTKKCDPPKIKGNIADFKIKNFGTKEIEFICKEGLGYGLNEKLEKLKNGQICVGLMHNENIAAYSWIALDEIEFRNKKITLKENESYLGGMFTVESYRGKNLAAFLRHKVYGVLDTMKRDTIYSITDYYNSPAIKFKQKLNSKHLGLYLYINLFNRFEWNFLIREYED